MKDGDDVKLVIGTDDEDNVSIKDVIDAALDLMESESDQEISFQFSGDGGPPEVFSFKPSDINDSEKAAEAKKYIEQLEGISGSLESVLEKYKSLSGGA